MEERSIILDFEPVDRYGRQYLYTDIISTFTDTLSEEIAKSIDAEIIKSIINLANCYPGVLPEIILKFDLVDRYGEDIIYNGLKVKAIPIIRGTKKLKAKWTPEMAEDLGTFFNIDF